MRHITTIQCCGKRRCPELFENDDGTYKLTDDFGGSVTLTKEQLEKLAKITYNLAEQESRNNG